MLASFMQLFIKRRRIHQWELSDRAQRKLTLTAERTAAVEAMDATDFKVSKVGGFGVRILSEEDGGVMEYTRCRHRYIGDYVHGDVSGDFHLSHLLCFLGLRHVS
jgi:hypothetical protein